MISVNNVSFSYGKTPFIQDLSFDVKAGEIFGFLGPSGAGKSTLQKMMTGLISKYKGSISVNGMNPSKENPEVFYEHIGIDFEYPSLYEKLTAKENLDFFSSLYSNKKKYTSLELLEMVGLAADAYKKVGEFSKGMKSRLNFVKSIVHNPDIIFLDEPTSGLDPSNAIVMKDIIKKLQKDNKTIILTTHNMYDATELCNRVAFIIDGQLKAIDSPHNMILERGGNEIKYSWINDNGKEEFKTSKIKNCSQDKFLQELIQNNKLVSIHSSEPTLNDIFVEQTGRQLI